MIDVGFTAHPSFLKLPQDMEGIKIPISIAWGDKDMQVKPAEIENAKAALAKAEGVDTEVVVYKGAGHGFAIRADLPKSPDDEKFATESEDQAVNFFKKHFANVKF